MFHRDKMNMEQDSEFKWGATVKVLSSNKDIKYYQSFTFHGVEYSLYDCVYLYQSGALETYIGKIIRIYSTATEKKIKVVWFFRPAEICDFLGDYDPQWNEIFLASGEGEGVSNVNSLEAIVGKCNVICRSKNPRNPRPSEEELRMANYMFRCTFDVKTRKILQKFPDEICWIKVEEYFNKTKQQNCSRIPKDQAGPSNVSSNSLLEKVVAYPVKNGKPKCVESKNWARPELRDQAGPSNVPSNSQLHKVASFPVINGEPGSKPVPIVEVKRNAVDPLLPPVIKPDTHPHKKMKTADSRLPMKTADSRLPMKTADSRLPMKTSDSRLPMKTADRLPMKTADSRLPDIDRSGWFKTGLWEERLRAAEGNGTLVLLSNLDPSTVSSEVQHLVWTAFELKVEAKMIACTPFSNPLYGKAFIIFKSSDDAESSINQLNRRCLLADGRPLIGTICRGTRKEQYKTSRFFGHLAIDKHRLKSQREEMRKAVSTSHFAQPNTVEYDMAMDWCLLQAKSDLWWKALYQDHEEKENEIKKLGKQTVEFQ